jgi:uncharacterized protein YwqG
MARDWDNLRRLIKEYGFEADEETLLQYARPSIRVHTRRVQSEDELLLGASKVGGRPDLPVGMAWPSVHHSNSHEKLSLWFVAQFNMADAKPHDEEDLLPRTGWLYFFIRPWDGLLDKDMGKVIYFDGDLSQLERKPFPDDIPVTPPNEWGERFDPCAVELVAEVNFDKSLAEILNIYESRSSDPFDSLGNAADYAHPSWDINRLLGVSAGDAWDFPEECELVARGYYRYTTNKEERAQAAQTKHEWQLLFEMSSDERAGMMWSDAGIVCWYLRTDDLLKKDFSKACAAFGSG